ncbi:MAG: hypothetical protein IVW57_06310 [Ktedonobacterales bacterium]|nr:hypothetical protein [Ktedonobacterales bacterium]
MVTYEEITEMVLAAAEETGLSMHPEFWLNTQTLEREFACTLHPGPCEDAEHRAACTLSFAWAPLDTVLSFEGAEGVCEFFHEPDEECPHLHTENVPPLVLDLSYTLPLEHLRLSEVNLHVLARTLKLRASEHSGRAVETRSTIALALGESSMETEALTLRQRVELPLWNPDGVNGFRAGDAHREGHGKLPGSPRRRARDAQDTPTPHPEDWLPHLCVEVAEDIAHVLEAMESARTLGRISGAHESGSEN